MAKALTWFGPFEGSGAYPTINRHLSAAMERRGWRVLRNQHNDGARLTDVAVAHIFPPRAINVRHDLNIALTAWEFAGPRALPRAFVDALRTYDRVCAPAQWTAGAIGLNINQLVRVVPWGIDLDEFAPYGDIYEIPDRDPGKVYLLWVGGTDIRHGFDIAVKMMDHLPEKCHLIAKQSVHYPPDKVTHHKVTIIRDDLPSLAPLYRACDLYVHPARGVGFSLPVLEAIACGLRVASSQLPIFFNHSSRQSVPEPIFGSAITFADEGEWVPFEHHINSDCLPHWMETTDASVTTGEGGNGLCDTTVERIRQAWTWDNAAAKLESVILEG
ncbi:MAG: glycosyltransferase [Planctomycetota bacterium]|jgi:glycosyltransferase involved in cell wall biosynthesis